MSEKQRNEIMRQLDSHGESYGLDLVERSGGILSRSAVYVLLSRMGDEGTIAHRDVPNGELPARRLYRLASKSARSSTEATCWCSRCEDLRIGLLPPAEQLCARRFIVCPTCGNKRCPRASHHIHACTGSNEPGQPGSRY